MARSKSTRNRGVTTSSLKALNLVDRIVLRIRGKKVVFSIRDELKISREHDVDMYQAEKYAFWRRLANILGSARTKAERELSKQHDIATALMPEVLKEQGKMRSDSQIRANVRMQPKVLEAQVQLDKLVWMEDLARMMVDAFEHRRAVLMKKKRAV